MGTSWRWKTDDPEYVINESLKEHDRRKHDLLLLQVRSAIVTDFYTSISQSVIKQLLGMPGVRPDRFLEARTPRHAALSLVGEPVMYRKFSLHSQTLVLSNAILSIGLTSTHQKVHWSFD